MRKKKEKQIIATYCGGHVHIRLIPQKGEVTHSRTGCISLKKVNCPIYDITNLNNFSFLECFPEEAIGKNIPYYEGKKVSLEEYKKKLVECGGVLIEDKEKFMEENNAR